MKSKILIMFLYTTGLIILGMAFIWAGAAYAAQEPISGFQQEGSEACLACHGTTGQTHELPSNELLYISIVPETYENSVHGQAGLECTDCHTDISGYPHPPIEAETRREYSLNQVSLCFECHQDQVDMFTNDAHQQALERGVEVAAVCTDCHSAHDVVDPSQPRSRIPQTCARCHSQIYGLYEESVHGEALLGAGNPDVPSCVECHNAHNVQGPTNTAFRLWSPQICARCHADEELMEKYGVNTDVFDTYVSDFHGTTVTLYQSVAPGQEFDKPVCIDCHGVHDIVEANDPNSTVIKENILTTCRKCHPDATTNFPGAWLSHYAPSPEHAPLVYFARLFYLIFIPLVIIPMAIFVATDIYRRSRRPRPVEGPGEVAVYERPPQYPEEDAGEGPLNEENNEGLSER